MGKCTLSNLQRPINQRVNVWLRCALAASVRNSITPMATLCWCR